MSQALILRARSCCCWESLIFVIVALSRGSLCASPPVLSGCSIQAWTSGRCSGCPCHLPGLWLVHERTKCPLLKAWSWHHEFPAAKGLLWASWDSSFILPVVPGAPALPETLCPQHAWPAVETIAASLSWWYTLKILKYYVFPTGASEDAGLSG